MKQISLCSRTGCTRPHHVKWNGAVLSLDDPVLDLHWAPDEPRCRGWMSQTRKPLNDRNINFSDLNNELTPWNINPGKFGRVVTNDHPYFQVKNFKDIAKQAMEAVLVNQRQEVLDFWKGELKGKSETVLTADKRKVQLRLADIGKALEAPSKNEWFRNELVRDLREVVKEMEFVKVKGQDRVYRLEVYGRKWEVKLEEVGEPIIKEVVELK